MQAGCSGADKESFPYMASMVSRFAIIALLLTPAMCVASELSPQQRAWYQSALNGGGGGNAPNPHRIGDAVVEWQALTRPGSRPSFDRIAAFLMQHQGWPNEADLRRAAEASLDVGGYVPPSAAAFFDRFAPVTAGGHLRHALALTASNRGGDAIVAARRAWSSGALTEVEAARLMALYGAQLTTTDHDARMERLLWSGATTAAARQIVYVSAARRLEFDARLAMRSRGTAAALRAAEAERANPDLVRRNAGYIVDRATWLRTTGQAGAAQTLLSAPRDLSAPPLDAEEWYETLLTNARAALASGNGRAAVAIAGQVQDGIPAGANILEQAIGVRDDYTNLLWLAGDTAMRRTNQPAEAARLFEMYSNGGRSPQVRARGLYWAGRAAEQAGNRGAATDLLTRAARNIDQFHGQLALERLGQPQPRPQPPASVSFSAEERDAFTNNSLVRAARVLGEVGTWRDQTQFLRAIAQIARSDAQHHFAMELAREINRPDLAVMVGRSARANGLDDYIPAAFPTVQVPAGQTNQWTFIHAISRQESQFDRAAVSHAGARGMMQLMPGTAREQSARLGLRYDMSALTSDPQYNIMLGSDYFQRMLSYFGGSYPLAVAAYNAGPGNVNRWLASNGDPRNGSIDILQWIEAIPLSETRGYVQRVLENAVVYETINPHRRDAAPPRNLLSRYLGRTPG
jgi:soluble lytic murein transglycosylase